MNMCVVCVKKKVMQSELSTFHFDVDISCCSNPARMIEELESFTTGHSSHSLAGKNEMKARYYRPQAVLRLSWFICRYGTYFYLMVQNIVVGEL